MKTEEEVREMLQKVNNDLLASPKDFSMLAMRITLMIVLEQEVTKDITILEGLK